MKFPPSTLTSRTNLAVNTNAANTAVTVNASANEIWVIDHIIWSIDRATVNAGDVKLTVKDVTNNTTKFEIGINDNGMGQVNFQPDGLVIGKNTKFQVYIVDDGTVGVNHLNVIYR